MYQYRDATRLASWTQLLLIVFMLAMAWAVVVDLLHLRLLYLFDSGGYPSVSALNDAFLANDARQHFTKPLRWVSFAVSGVLVLAWTWRANANARGLGAAGMRFTPAWSVGWYFVPLANLVKPYDAMREIWLASAFPEGWSNQAEPLRLRWWWVFLLVAVGLGVLAPFLADRARGMETLIDATWLLAMSDLAFLLSAAVLVWTIARVQSMQAAHVPPG